MSHKTDKAQYHTADSVQTIGRRAGKTIIFEQARRQCIRENPLAVIAYYGPNGIRIEKPVDISDCAPELNSRI